MRKYTKIICCAISICALSVVSAFAFGGLTIEELIERYGISRQIDRVIDIREVMMSSAELTDLLPEEYRSPSLDDIIGDDSLSSLYKAWERNKTSLYKAGTTLWQEIAGISPQDITGPVMLGSGVASGKEFSILKDFDWTKDAKKQEDKSRRAVKEFYTGPEGEKSEFQKINEELDVLDINETIENIAEESLKDKYTDSMKDFGPEAVTSSAAALQGITHQPYAYADTGVQRAHVSDYTLNAAAGRIEKITKILADAEAVRKSTKFFEDRLRENMTEYAESENEFGGQGGAWKAVTAGYTTIARHNIDRQVLISQMYKLLALNIRMRNQYFATFMYDYVSFTRARLDKSLVEEQVNRNVEGH